MAVSKIKSVHRWQGKTVFQTLFETIRYALNPAKTTYRDDGGNEKILTNVYECGKNALEAANDWLFSKNLYAKLTGRNQGDSDVLAYHIIQSFDPSDNIAKFTEDINCVVG